MGDGFYQSLKGFDRFSDLTDISHYTDAPADWHAVVTDIQGSTRAIEKGRYKDVNLAGAAVITSVLNATGDKTLPYAFGGDGATLLIPAYLAEKTQEALSAVAAKIRAGFGLELRAGSVPLQTLYDAGGWLKIAKFNLSPQMSQAVFQGTALGLAEKWLKTNDPRIQCPPAAGAGEPDLSGLKCRWQPIASRNGKVISVLVRTTDKHAQAPWVVYGEILQDIATIYPDFQMSNPAYLAGLDVSFSASDLGHEARLRGNGQGVFKALWTFMLLAVNAFNKILFLGKHSPVGGIGRKYLSEMSANSDSRKFDEMLRMVIDSTPEQKKSLEEVLARRRESGDIVYGLHASDKALMTCLVFSVDGNHVHFIDGADGGYALAAKEMKAQMND